MYRTSDSMLGIVYAMYVKGVLFLLFGVWCSSGLLFGIREKRHIFCISFSLHHVRMGLTPGKNTVTPCLTSKTVHSASQMGLTPTRFFGLGWHVVSCSWKIFCQLRDWQWVSCRWPLYISGSRAYTNLWDTFVGKAMRRCWGNVDVGCARVYYSSVTLQDKVLTHRRYIGWEGRYRTRGGATA